MKKFVTAILALAMVLSLAACGEKKVQLKILDTEYAVEDYAIAIAKENTDLLDEVNAALAAITADGTAQKWWASTRRWPRPSRTRWAAS